MRIRQVRPEFFTDDIVAQLTPAHRLTYIGLWCVADDDGWLVWNVQQIAVQLYPYESVRVRTKRIADAGAALVGLGRLVIHDCGCADIPKLKDHQRIGGNRSTSAHDRHTVHTRMDKSAGKVGNGMVGEGKVNARERTNEDDPDRAATLAAFRRQGLPVDVVA